MREGRLGSILRSAIEDVFAQFHTGYAIAVYLAVCAVISYVSTAYMPDYTSKNVHDEYDHVA